MKYFCGTLESSLTYAIGDNVMEGMCAWRSAMIHFLMMNYLFRIHKIVGC